MIEPLPCFCMCGIAYLQHRYTEVRFTCCTRCQASRPVVRIESSSGGEIPALLNATSSEPYWSTAVWNSAWTWASSETSVCTNRPLTSSAAALPDSAETSAITTFAPSLASLRADASPIPLPPPVITATRPSKRCITYSSVEIKTFLVSVKASTASGPSSRPRPDCLNPPNGAQYRTEECELTERLPASTPRETRS